MTDALIDAVPVQDAIDAPAAPFRRGPGRPKGSRNRPRIGVRLRRGESGETPPQRPGVLPKRPASLEIRIGGFLSSINMVVMLIPPIREDALDTAEITALARALDQQCSVSPRFRKYMESALGVGSGAQLFGVIAIIVARRAARHGLMGEQGGFYDQMLGAMIAGQEPPEPEPGPTSDVLPGDELRAYTLQADPVNGAHPIANPAANPVPFVFEVP